MADPLTPTRRRVLRATRVLAFAGLLAFVLHAGLGLGGHGIDGFFDRWVYNALVVIAAGWCLARAALVRADRLAWSALGLGLGCWAIAEILNTVLYSTAEYAPYPSISDAFWIAFFPLAYVGIILLVRGQVGNFRSSMWLDGIVAGLSVTALGEILVFQPILESTGGRPIEIATDLAYPLADLLMLALVIGVFALMNWRPGRAWAFIGAGLAAAAIADSVYAYQASQGTYAAGALLDALWPAATLLVGWAAWTRTPRKPRVQLQGWRAMALPTTFALIGLGIMVYDHFVRVDAIGLLLATAALAVVIVRTAMTFGENLDMLRSSRVEALTDALTGLGNRRSLMSDLDEALAGIRKNDPRALILFDLDGFKRYNDSFGHPAGDALLARLGRSFEVAAQPYGRAYRLGGDEFCALVAADSGSAPGVVALAAAALSEQGQGFAVAASHGVVLLPSEADEAATAMQIADRRLYGNKGERKRNASGQQTRDVLMQVLHERQPGLHEHHHDVAELTRMVGLRMAMSSDDVDTMVRAAELHDVGKMAIPDEILDKPGPLDPIELDFIRRHTLVGERMLAAAPSLAPAARIVRSTHENWDGSGYPDGLAGEAIPLPARVIAVCDAYDAMTSDRPYQPPIPRADALAELRRCAGTHFDPYVAAIFCEAVESGDLPDAEPAPPIDVEPLAGALLAPGAVSRP